MRKRAPSAGPSVHNFFLPESPINAGRLMLVSIGRALEGGSYFVRFSVFSMVFIFLAIKSCCTKRASSITQAGSTGWISSGSNLMERPVFGSIVGGTHTLPGP